MRSPVVFIIILCVNVITCGSSRNFVIAGSPSPHITWDRKDLNSSQVWLLWSKTFENLKKLLAQKYLWTAKYKLTGVSSQKQSCTPLHSSTWWWNAKVMFWGESQNSLRMRLKSSKTHLLAYRAGCTTLAWVMSSFLMASTVSSSTVLKVMVMVIIAITTTIANSQRPIVRRQVVGQPLTSLHPGTLCLLRTVAATAPSLLLEGKLKSSRSLFTLSILRPFSIAGKMDPWIILPWAPPPQHHFSSSFNLISKNLPFLISNQTRKLHHSVLIFDSPSW